MGTRDLWLKIMHYQEFDRLPVVHWSQWPETLERWKREGLAEDGDVRKHLGAAPHWAFVGVNVALHPPFAEEVYEETGEYRIFRDRAGVVCKDFKHASSIPHYLDYTLKDASGWETYKQRLQPDPGRIPDDLDERIARAEASGLPIAVATGSMMGWIRNWMGVENMSFLMFDDPDVYGDMVRTIAELTCWGIDQVVPRMSSPPDMGFGWEDIAGRSGPLVSPSIFREHVAPGYRMIREKLDSYGVPLLGIDSDGDVEPLIADWLDAGVNVLFPIEIGVWQADPMALRRQFGQELRIIGGYDKRAIEHGPAAIDAEFERRLPLIRDGGFVPMPDHLITPDTSLDDYRYFIERLREMRI